MDERRTAGSGSTLNGWKEIAGHLGKSVRSVQRWEEQLGLPVHRIQTPKGQIVYAYSGELDLWRARMAQRDADYASERRGSDAPSSLDVAEDSGTRENPDPRDIPEPPRRRPLVWLAVFLSIGLVALLAWMGAPWRGRLEVPPEGIRLVGRVLEAFDHEGRVLWTHRFERDVSVINDEEANLSFDSSNLLDLDGDGEVEVLAPIRHATAGRVALASDALYCFDVRGRMRWRISSDQVLTFGGRSFSAPWTISSFAVSDRAPRRIWVAWNHHTWWPGVVAEISADGRSRTVYVQAGRLYALAYWNTPPGPMLAVGGISQGSRHPSVVMLQPGSPPAFFADSDAPEYECRGCGAVRPRRVYLFEPIDLAPVNRNRVPFVRALQAVGVSLKAWLFEGGSEASFGTSAAFISPDFSVESVTLGDAYGEAHREWERQGRLDHAYENCPDRVARRSIRTWTPDDGWVDAPVSQRP